MKRLGIPGLPISSHFGAVLGFSTLAMLQDIKSAYQRFLARQVGELWSVRFHVGIEANQGVKSWIWAFAPQGSDGIDNHTGLDVVRVHM